MANTYDSSKKITPRENFLISLLKRLLKEYRELIEITRHLKPFKIVDIIHFSNIPGETKFTIQITNKNSTINLKASEIIHYGYNLNDFDKFHAEMIRQAAIGKLAEFLSISKEPICKIVSKLYDREQNVHIFTIETEEENFISKTALEISNDKKLLLNLQSQDVFDVGFTQGSESVLKEQLAIKIAKQNNQRISNDR